MVIKMASHFQLKPEYFSEIKYRPESIKQPTAHMDLNQYSTAEEAYHNFMYQLVKLQAASSKLVLGKTNISNIYVDGGFSKNELFMYLMAEFFPSKNIYASSVAQASAFGAAIVIHNMWNNTPLPNNLVKLHHYEVKKQ
jgi:glycerol kinase